MLHAFFQTWKRFCTTFPLFQEKSVNGIDIEQPLKINPKNEFI